MEVGVGGRGIEAERTGGALDGACCRKGTSHLLGLLNTVQGRDVQLFLPVVGIDFLCPWLGKSQKAPSLFHVLEGF